MSYTKQTWNTGDVITADKLNHMEDGIASSGGGSTGYDFVLARGNSLTAEGLSVDEMIQKGAINLKACYDDDGRISDAVIKEALPAEGGLSGNVSFQFAINEDDSTFTPVIITLSTDGSGSYRARNLTYTYSNGHYTFTLDGSDSE